MFRSVDYFRTLSENLRGRDFFVGDIHGHYTALIQSLNAVGFHPAEDRLISVGDLIDRGPESTACIELLEAPWFEACLGNHERMLLSYYLDDDDSLREVHQRSGGRWVEQFTRDQLRHWSALIRSRCPLALEVKFGSRRIGVTHNDVIGLDWQVMRKKASAKQVDHCVWSRNRFNTALSHPLLANPIANIDLVVSGHNPHPTPVWAGNQVYIDTLWKGGAFTLMSAEDLFVAHANQSTVTD